ncbi:unnamed protein product [Moneuplotes crassus]|uniref:Uncharacterized protein n=1 Tax=Euplotes crassus TaxID=5936 RepID=A0AAD1U6A3_EUPCR|nr:unnamed protein product [Moneuplotes crassus]
MKHKLAFLFLCILCVSFCAIETEQSQEELQEIQQISDRIEQLHKRLYLIKHIRNGKIKIPKDLDLEKIEIEDPSFENFETFEDFSIDKYLTTKGTIESKPGEEIVEFLYFQPPNFWTQSKEMINPRSQVLAVLQNNKVVRIYSVATLSLISEFDISSYLDQVQDLKKEIVSFKCSDANPDEPYLLILTKSGDVISIRLNLMNVEAQPDETASNVKGKKDHQAVRVVKTFYAASSISFNMWDTIVSNNQTLYQEDVETRLSEGVAPIALEFSGKGMSGNIIIADSQGFFNIYRKAIPDKNKPTEDKALVNLISRSHSGFDSIDLITRHHMLMIYSSGSQISFLRTFDGQMMKASCEVGTKQISTISHDPTAHGRFYVGTHDGDVIIYELLQNKKSLGCSIAGKITGEASGNYSTFPLNRFILQAKDSGEINVFNITESRLDETKHDWNKLKGVKYKPEILKELEFESLKFDALVTQKSSHLAIQVINEGREELVLIEVFDSEIFTENFLASIAQSNYFIIGISFVGVIIYQFLFKQPRRDKRKQKYNHLDERETGGKANTKLDDLTKRLESLDSTSELLSKIGKDPTTFDSGKAKRRKEKYGNKIDFLE